MWLDSESMQSAFRRLPWLKLGLVALLLLLLGGSVFWVWKAYTLWEEREEAFPLMSYENRGAFDYSVYVESTHLFGSPQPETPEWEVEARPLYFTNIINDINVRFNYKFVSRNPVKEVYSQANISAIVTGPSGWEKRFLLKSATELSDSFSISFPLELEEFKKEIKIIEEDLPPE